MTKTKQKPAGIQMTGDQVVARDALVEAWKAEKPLTTLGGYAGTGKTTTIVEFVRQLGEQKERPPVAFCAFTGRAASVLRSKLEKSEVFDMTDYAGTIHGLIYKPRVEKGIVVGWEKRNKDEFAHELIVVDEASMLNETIFEDLKSYEVPIIAVGDHGQLPPVNGTFNLMEKPDVRLERIHRQAEGDPIVHLSMVVREGGAIPAGQHGPRVLKTSDRTAIDRTKDLSEAMILCGRNRTRVGLNAYVRNRLGIAAPGPQKGEKVICLKNNRNAGIYNGMLGRIKSISPGDDDHWTVELDMEGGFPFAGTAWRKQFGSETTVKPKDKQEARHIGDLFDWGYAMTVHKSQGSEAKNVVLFEERMPMMSDDDWKRWLYTAVTRARESLLVIGA